MTTAKDPPEPSASPSDAKGVAVIAAITVAVTGWMYSQRPQGAAQSTPIFASDFAALSGFRPDAWFLPDDDLLGFVEIPAGPFRMGSDPNIDPRAVDNERWSASSDQGTVDLPVYYIGRYEVTVAQFRTFVQATEFSVDAQALGGPPGRRRVVAGRTCVLPMARDDVAGMAAHAAAAEPFTQRWLARDPTE